jgi:type I restriction enzyme R subunit
VVLAEKIRSLAPAADVSEVMQSVEDLLDRSVAAEGYVIREGSDHKVDLSQIDFEALKKRFANGRKHIEAEKLKGQLSQKLKEMVRQNRLRLDFLKKFQEMIEEYNSGSHNIEAFFKMLTEFAKNLSYEEQRVIRERLSEEELALFDILTKPDMHLNDKETKDVKRVARELLETLKREKLVLDWRKRQQSRAQVRLTVEQVLDRLPEKYTRQIFADKCNVVYQHIFDSYYGENRSIYAARY